MQAKLHASERLLQDLIGSQQERNTTYEDLIKVKQFKAACMQLLGSMDGSQLIDPKKLSWSICATAHSMTQYTALSHLPPAIFDLLLGRNLKVIC